MSIKKDIFIDQSLQQKLDRDGIVSFKLPNAKVVDSCVEVIESMAPPVPSNMKGVFYSGVMDTNVNRKYEISDALRNAIEPALMPMIRDYHFISFTYMVKATGDSSMLDLHQDWSVTNEQEGWSYNLWIPLIDSNEDNGTLFALQGSHHFPDNIRGGGIFPKHRTNRALALKHMQPYNVKRGEAVIFNSRLIHYSPTNKTNNSRVSVAGTLTPNGVPITLYNGSLVDGKLKVKAYNVPSDFYLRYTNFMAQKDETPEFAEFDHEVVNPNVDPISDAAFQKLLDTIPKRPWYKRIFEW